MESQPNNEPRKPLVSVEFQTEVDVATGDRERRMFIKMYFEARDSGLLAAIPGELWKMLCCLATYMNEDGNCYPTQDRIARDLGIRRQRVNERIQDLLNFRFQGQPVLSLKPKTRFRGRWSNNVYRIQPVSALKIFDKTEVPTVSANPDMAENRPTVSASTDTVITDTAGTDTNQMQRLTRRLNVNDLEKSALKKGVQDQSSADSEFRAALERRMLVADILEVCGDQHSRGFYTRVVQKVPAELIRAALSETKYRGGIGSINKSKGAFFTNEITRIAKDRGIDLQINMPRAATGATSSHQKQGSLSPGKPVQKTPAGDFPNLKGTWMGE
jgi:hypothetical protein